MPKQTFIVLHNLGGKKRDREGKKRDRLLFRRGLSRAATLPERGFKTHRGGKALLPGHCAKRGLPIHALTDLLEFMIEQRLQQPRLPITRRLDRPGIHDLADTPAGPGPLPGMVDKVSPEGVPQHIPEHGEEVSVLLDGKTFEAALPDMPLAAVVPMVAADMAGHPPLHEGTEGIRMHGLQHRMKMVRHQAKAKYLDGILALGRDEQIEEGLIVAGFVENSCATIASIQHMVGMATELSTRDARHGGK